MSISYYNEFDPKAAAWIQQLIDDKQIPYGYVDSRSITEVQPSDLRGFTQCHFFAGIGGWARALHLAGWSPDRPVWTASLPCQPFSSAGKQLGTDDERHLAPVFLELVRQCNPPSIFGEQVASKLARTDWLPGIRLDLEALGYSFGAADLCAPCAGEIGEGWIVRGDSESWERVIIGHPHIRQRLYWVAHTNGLDRIVVSRHEVESAQQHEHPNTSGVANPSGGDELRDSRRCDEGTGSCGEPFGRGLQQTDSDGSHSGLPDTLRRRHQVDVQPVSDSGETQRVREADVSRSRAAHELIPCRDSKTRRTQSGIFPLVNGLPRGVVPSGDPSDPSYANATAEGRAVRLKGYGNAIVPTLAALFITSYMEATQP